MERFISTILCFLVVFHSIGDSRESTVIAQSLEPRAITTASIPPDSSDTTYTKSTSDATESLAGTSESHSISTTLVHSTSEGTSPESSQTESSTIDSTALASTSEASSPAEDGASIFDLTTLDSTPVTTASSVVERSLTSTRIVGENTTDATQAGSHGEGSSHLNSVQPPWLKSSRITREEEVRKSLSTPALNHVERPEENVHYLNEQDSMGTNLLSANVISPDHEARGTMRKEPTDQATTKSGEDFKSRGGLSEGGLSNVELVRDERKTGNSVEDLEDAEDRYGAGYPYWYRQQFLRERYWPIYRRHPFNYYLRYPIFPGR